MIRSISNDEYSCLNIETVICKVYFPQYAASPEATCELKQQSHKEIRRFNISCNNSFGQFLDLITSSIVEPSADIEFLYLDSDSYWVKIRDNEQWTRALYSARRVADKKQLRVKVTTRNGSSVTPKLTSPRQKNQSKKTSSCCIVPTKAEAYPCMSSNFLSIKQDFGDLQKQMEALRLQQQGQQKEVEKRKKKKVHSEKKKRPSKNAPAEIVTQMVYSEMFSNWSPSKWGSGSHTSTTSIAVL
jgi:hypothetical protein